ncbi:MAG: hypothetical protein GVY28_02510 [Alphaproteobacteria bacterium]|jgi:hypothetical protein|nr:hypothetical protein [Alphaproteobacteria bacterium]
MTIAPSPTRSIRRGLGVAAVLAFAAGPVLAQDIGEPLDLLAGAEVPTVAEAPADPGPFDVAALPDSDLSGMRGGFISMGVIEYFEVELSASVDGVELYNYGLADLTANTTLTETIPGTDGPKATSTVTRDPDRLLTVVQVGPNNVVNGINPGTGAAAFANASGFYNVVQNTVSGVMIRQDATFRIGLNESMVGSMTAARGLANSFDGARSLTLR